MSLLTSQMHQEIWDQHSVARGLIQDRMPEMAAARAELQRFEQIVLVGTGASLLACKAAQLAFVAYQGRLPHVLPAEQIPLVGPCFGPKTLVLLVSQSGQSYETQLAIDVLRQRGIPFWGLTNQPDSLLAKEADRLLLMNAGEEVSSATKTYTATLLILLMLAATDDEQARRLCGIPADLEASLAMVEAGVGPWAERLDDEQVLYVLGVGTQEATAQQAALLLKEKVFLHAEGLSLSEFRHGNIEVVHPGLPLVLVAMGEAETTACLRHAEYFATLGANLFLVTDQQASSPSIPPEQIIRLCHRGDGFTASIPAVIPFQLLAERMASQKGFDVDGFRFIAKTVDHYRF